MKNQTSRNEQQQKPQGAFKSFVIHSLVLTVNSCIASGYNAHQGRIPSHLIVFHLFKLKKTIGIMITYMITVSPSNTLISPTPDSDHLLQSNHSPSYSHVLLSFPFLSSPCTFLPPLPFPFFLWAPWRQSYLLCVHDSKGHVIPEDSDPTHPFFNQSLQSIHPSSSIFPEHWRGWHRCLIWGQAYRYHLFLALWPVMGPSLTTSHCWSSFCDQGLELHKSIGINVFRRQFDYVSIWPNISSIFFSFCWLFLHLIHLLLFHLQPF